MGSRIVADVPELAEYTLLSDVEPGMVVLDLDDIRGKVLMRCQNRPVIVQGSVGAGRVTLVGFDPTAKPFSQLADRAGFWKTMLGMEATRRERNQVGTLRHVSGPLIQALSDFPGFKPINFALVGAFMLVYVVLIGPVDYFVLKGLKKLHWTWITFPSVAILCSVIAFWVLSSGRVSEMAANTLSLVDASEGGEDMSGTTFMTLLSPKQTRYTVGLDGVDDGAVLPREYQALAAGGGMNLSQSRCYVYGAGEMIDDLLVRVWDAQTFEASWRAPVWALPETELRMDSDGLRGVIKNTTGHALHSLVVLHNGRVMGFGNVQPNATAQVSRKGLQSLHDYAHGLATELVSVTHGGMRRWQTFSGSRDNADKAARWITLFGDSGKDEAPPVFRRWVRADEEHTTVAFDLPARLQCAGLDSSDEAILLYSVEQPAATIRFKDYSPKRWDLTLMRVRVPVRPARNAQGGES